jgi:transposase
MRLVAESRRHHDSEWAVIPSVAAKLGVGTAETVRKWVRRAEIEAALVQG